MAIFEKKIRSIANTIKDEFIKKYVLEYFLEKINSLTPNSNLIKRNFYTKKAQSLKSTQKHFHETKTLSHIELKEYSFLCLIFSNLQIVQENFHLIENVKLFTKENKLIFENIFNRLANEEDFSIDEISVDKELIDKIFKFASIKHILSNHKNDNHKVLELLEEIIRDLKNYELEFRIEELESKFSKDLSESTFNEIRELKKLQKIN
jgi:DNA primase